VFVPGSVADVVPIPAMKTDGTVDPAGTNVVVHDTSQSPAVKLSLVAFADVAVVSDVPVAEFVTYSPTDPAFTLLFVVVPTIPAV
jgi:hypothetical protein